MDCTPCLQAGSQTGTADPRDGGSGAGTNSSNDRGDDGTLERVKREAAISASVSHPNVVATYHHHLERVIHKDTDPGAAAVDSRISLDGNGSGSAGGASVEGKAARVVGGGCSEGGAAGQGGRGDAGGGRSGAQVWRLVVVLELCDVGSLRDCLQGELLAGHDVEVAVEQQQQQQLLLKQLKQVQQHKELECAGAGAGGERGVTTRPEAGGEGTGTRAVAETAAAAAEGLSGSVYDNPLATAWFSRAQPHPHARVVALLALQVARGVAYLHSSGVVHCALSSANVLLKRAGAGGGAPEGPDASTSGGDGRSRTGGEGGGGVVAQGQQFWCSYVAKVG